ncbi:MFS transporter [Allokutzneria multivorans]|uniref:MFS transporter n=1 Tax=Allokutzneria multivorans TaxID=1142134 RepID=A0ABP7SCZ5_9PSEU
MTAVALTTTNPTIDHPVRPYPRLLLAFLALGTCIQALVSAGFAVALPAIRTEFGLNTETAWVVAALYLATGVGAPIIGRLADLYGARPVFTGGLALTVAGAALGTWAPDLTTLLISRVILGLGSAAQFPAAVAILRTLNAERGTHPAHGLPVISGAVQAALACGPVLGGLLTQLAGWRAVTALALPLALGSALAVHRLAPARPAHRPPTTSASRALDLPGMVIGAATMTTALVLLLELSQPRWWMPLALTAQITALVWWERGHAHPFLDLNLLRGNRTLTGTYLRTAAVYLGLDLILYGLPVWLQEHRHYAPATTGALMLPLAASATVGIWAAGRALPRLGARPLLLLAAGVLATAALALLGILTSTTSDALLVTTVALLGFPVGVHNLVHQSRCLAAAPEAQVATSTGLLRAGQYLGSCAAAGILAVLAIPAPTGMITLAVLVLVLAVVLGAHALRLR